MYMLKMWGEERSFEARLGKTGGNEPARPTVNTDSLFGFRKEHFVSESRKKDDANDEGSSQDGERTEQIENGVQVEVAGDPGRHAGNPEVAGHTWRDARNLEVMGDPGLRVGNPGEDSDKIVCQPCGAVEEEEAREAVPTKTFTKVSKEERERHELTHAPFRSLCRFSLMGRE